MFAVVEIGGKQFTVKEQEKVKVPLLTSEIGETVTFDRVLLFNKDGETKVGQPTVEDAAVSGTVVEHGKDKKVVVFKKKRRKDYRRKTGHRQDYSVVKIDTITG